MATPWESWAAHWAAVGNSKPVYRQPESREIRQLVHLAGLEGLRPLSLQLIDTGVSSVEGCHVYLHVRNVIPAELDDGVVGGGPGQTGRHNWLGNPSLGN
jgi:hypothetical protein